MIVGPDNVKKILLGEHSLVTSIWPPSFRAVLGDGALSMMDPHNHKAYRKVSAVLQNLIVCSEIFLYRNLIFAPLESSENCVCNLKYTV